MKKLFLMIALGLGPALLAQGPSVTPAYLSRSGGRLSGALTGTSASFSGAVNAAGFSVGGNPFGTVNLNDWSNAGAAVGYVASCQRIVSNACVSWGPSPQAASAWASLVSGTNTTMAAVVGSGASITPFGSGIIQATAEYVAVPTIGQTYYCALFPNAGGGIMETAAFANDCNLNYGAGGVSGSTLTIPNLTALYSLNLQTPSTAGSTHNYSSPPVNFNGSYWNGSVPCSETWSIQDLIGTGATPTEALTFHYTQCGAGTEISPAVNIPYRVTAQSFAGIGSALTGVGNPGNFIAVTWNPTVTFLAQANTTNAFTITLAGNVTGSTLSGSAAGQYLAFKICQDATGSRTFAWPTGFASATPVFPSPLTCTSESFFWDGSNAQPLAAAEITGSSLSAIWYGPTGSAPATPASGYLAAWFDTSGVLEVENSSGGITSTMLPVTDTTFTNATTAIGAGACSASATTVTVTGLSTSMVPIISPSTDVSGSTGWGASGGLVIDAWPSAANTLSYKICNQTSSSITPAAVTWNVSAR